MASRYWIGGSGNWTDTAHWSDTSWSGADGPGGFSYPIEGDIAIFEGCSVADRIVTLDIDVTCYRILGDWKGKAYGITLFSNSKKITCPSIEGGDAIVSIGPAFSKLNITNSRIETHGFMIYPGRVVIAGGSTLMIKSQEEFGAYLNVPDGGTFGDLIIDFNGIEDVILIEYSQDIYFDNVTTVLQEDLAAKIYFGDQYRVESGTPNLYCTNWALTGSVENNFSIEVNSMDYFYHPPY
jgi:hypothetical protein